MSIRAFSRHSQLMLVLVSVIVGAAACARAGDRPDIWQAPHFSATPKDLYEASSAAAPADGIHVTVLDDEATYSFDAEGGYTETVYGIYKVVTEKGVDGWDDLEKSWEPWHEDRPIIKARIITADFVAHELDPKTISDAPEGDDEDSVYQDRRVVRAPLPAISPGSVVEFEITKVSRVLYPGAGYEDYYFLGRIGVPVQHDRLILEAPSALSIQFTSQNLGDLKPVHAEGAEKIRLTFESGPLAPLDQEDTYLPNGVVENPLILFAVGTTWQRAAGAYAQILENTLGKAHVDVLVEKLVRGKKSDTEKEKAILAYIDRQIRYTGIEFGQNSVVPHEVAETLTRWYGDCKDKALLLVAMLRSAGITADVALLNSGEALGVEQDLAGVTQFDHAIVYVPGSPGLWIDPTDDYAPIGQVPLEDQGQLALVIRRETQGLIQIPEDSSQANRLVEIREFRLAENGPARIVERNDPRGGFEARYRRAYADKQDKKTGESLTSYFKTEYSSEGLDHWDRTDPADLSNQFELTLEVAKAKRGFTGLDSSVAAIPLGNIFSALPDVLQRRAEPDEKYPDTGKPVRKRTVDYELPEAFVKEWHYQIIPPLGFQAEALPHDTKISLGPAELTERFSLDASGVVHADFQFDSVKRRYTVAEATDLRNKVAEIESGEAMTISLFPRAHLLAQQGKFREAFQSYADAIAQHPKEAIHHLQLAQALLEAGSGEAARREAHLAVNLEPDSALAEKTLADVLEYDLVGRKLRPGSDYDGAAEAFRAAAKLDSKDKDLIGNWAILLEYNADGLRYGPGAKMKESVEVYRRLTREERSQIGVPNNLSYALFYSREFDEALHEAESLNPQPQALMVACVAALRGDQAALDELGKRGSSEADQKNTANAAGRMLMRIRRYPEAASLLQFGASGEDAARTMALADNLRKARLHEQIPLGNEPKDLMMKSLLTLYDPNVTVEKFKSISSKNARIVLDETDPEELSAQMKSGTQLRHLLARQDVALDFVSDLMVEAFVPKVEGNDKTGYRVKMELPGGKNLTMYVVKEDGEYRILDTLENANAIGLEILDRVEANDLDGAKALLDWLREDEHLAGGDDPISGRVFPRFWTLGKTAEAREMNLAAAAILVQSRPTARQGIAVLEEARKSSSNDAERAKIDVGLLEGYRLLNDAENTEAVAVRLTAQYPDSATVFFRHAWALAMMKRYREAQDLAMARLKMLPDDADAIHILRVNDQAQNDYRAAFVAMHQLVDAGKGSATDLNNAAWLSLYFDRAGGPDLETALKSTQLEPNNPHFLHTLGCMYAEMGKTKEAHQVLVQAMDLQNLDEPNSDYWYAFGRIAEQFGQMDIAREDYARVKKPKLEFDVPGSTYQLAQNRLEAMKNDHGGPGNP